MKMLITLLVLLVLVAGCSEAPFDPDRGASVVIGYWGGVSKITYPGPADNPITEMVNIIFRFEDDGSYSFYKQYEYDTNLEVVYIGTYVVRGSTITLTSEYDWLNYSPLDLSGIFQFSMDEGTLRLYQVLGDEFPEIHEVTLLKWIEIIPINPLVGEWSGMSYITYPNEVDAPTRDSLEVEFYFNNNFTFSLSAVGDWLSDPYTYYGTYELWHDRVVLTIDDTIPNNSPLNLQGPFDLTITDNTLRLYQHPEHIWPTIHEVLLMWQGIIVPVQN